MFAKSWAKMMAPLVQDADAEDKFDMTITIPAEYHPFIDGYTNHKKGKIVVDRNPPRRTPPSSFANGLPGLSFVSGKISGDAIRVKQEEPVVPPTQCNMVNVSLSPEPDFDGDDSDKDTAPWPTEADKIEQTKFQKKATLTPRSEKVRREAEQAEQLRLESEKSKVPALSLPKANPICEPVSNTVLSTTVLSTSVLSNSANHSMSSDQNQAHSPCQQSAAPSDGNSVEGYPRKRRWNEPTPWHQQSWKMQSTWNNHYSDDDSFSNYSNQGKWSRGEQQPPPDQWSRASNQPSQTDVPAKFDYSTTGPRQWRLPVDRHSHIIWNAIDKYENSPLAALNAPESASEIPCHRAAMIQALPGENPVASFIYDLVINILRVLSNKISMRLSKQPQAPARGNQRYTGPNVQKILHVIQKVISHFSLEFKNNIFDNATRYREIRIPIPTECDNHLAQFNKKERWNIWAMNDIYRQVARIMIDLEKCSDCYFRNIPVLPDWINYIEVLLKLHGENTLEAEEGFTIELNQTSTNNIFDHAVHAKIITQQGSLVTLDESRRARIDGDSSHRSWDSAEEVEEEEEEECERDKTESPSLAQTLRSRTVSPRVAPPAAAASSRSTPRKTQPAGKSVSSRVKTSGSPSRAVSSVPQTCQFALTRSPENWKHIGEWKLALERKISDLTTQSSIAELNHRSAHHSDTNSSLCQHLSDLDKHNTMIKQLNSLRCEHLIQTSIDRAFRPNDGNSEPAEAPYKSMTNGLYQIFVEAATRIIADTTHSKPRRDLAEVHLAHLRKLEAM
jgi:hypothetical protein